MQKIYIVTGAPGAGKTSALEAFLQLRAEPYIAFDIDWLAPAASDLAGASINFEASTWKPYAHLWFEVMNGVYKNGKVPVLFAPFDKSDIEKYGVPDWCSGVEWLLLDCDDDTRMQRLAQRKWTQQQLDEAKADASKLRDMIDNLVDTTQHNEQEAAQKIVDWLLA